MGLHDRTADRETEADSLRLGREERPEEIVAIDGRDARTRVRNANGDPVPESTVRMMSLLRSTGMSAIASMPFNARLMITCWSSTSSPRAVGMSRPRSFSMVTPCRRASCSRSRTTDSTTALRSSGFISASRLLARRLTRWITSLARWSSRRMSRRICRTSSNWPFDVARSISAVSALARMAPQRLVDLVRDRGHQLADRRQSRGLSELPAAVAGLLLGAPPLPTLDEQGDQEGGLRADRGHDRHDLPPVWPPKQEGYRERGLAPQEAAADDSPAEIGRMRPIDGNQPTRGHCARRIREDDAATHE